MTDPERLKLLLTCIDLTSLEATDHAAKIAALVQKANEGIDGVHPASVCVFPTFANLVRQSLLTGINTTVVGGAFPSGQTFLSVKLQELQEISRTGCDEVDVVINRGELIAGNYATVRNELVAMRQAIPHKTMKVILETGELESPGDIQKASQIAIEAGADFIKTSTGKSGSGASPQAVEIMCRVIADHHRLTGKKTGIKPSGGIRESADALMYMTIVEEILGEQWMTNKLFRIGASTLYDNVISDLTLING